MQGDKIMKRESKKGYLLFSAVIAFMVLSALTITGLAVVNHASSNRKNELENNYSRAFYDMCDSVNNLEINLSKLMVASGKTESLAIINDTTAVAEIAENSLSDLPLSYEQTIKTSKYFNQVSDWSRSYATAVVNGGSNENYTTQAENLYLVARSLNEKLKELSQKLGDRNIGECVGEDRLLPFNFSSAIGDIENNGIDYPQLIYDGPFSDAKKHIWRAVESADDISEEQAVKKAESVDGFKANKVYKTTGKTTVYEVEGSVEGDDAIVSVTEKGGMIVSYNRNRAVREVTLGKSRAIATAEEKIKAFGYDGLQAVWYNSGDGIAYINLAPVEREVIIYPDLVKVKIALDDGAILGIEASGYCHAHHDGRNLSPTIDEDTARSMVSKKIAVEKVSLAIIPDEQGEKEYFCYEVCGKYKGLDYFIYVDALSGTQRQVLRVIDGDQGEVVM